MREIKFRVWYNNKIYYDITGFEFVNNVLTGIFIDGDFVDKENIKLMQYTGLKDKNGKEIYEGDIVKAKFFEKHITGKIEFALGTFFVTGSAVSDNQMFIFNDFEVIGNIYDNSELLEV